MGLDTFGGAEKNPSNERVTRVIMSACDELAGSMKTHPLVHEGYQRLIVARWGAARAELRNRMVAVESPDGVSLTEKSTMPISSAVRAERFQELWSDLDSIFMGPENVGIRQLSPETSRKLTIELVRSNGYMAEGLTP